MPKRYEEMVKRFKREGLSTAKAKEKAARIYNATKKPGEPKLHHSRRKR